MAVFVYCSKAYDKYMSGLKANFDSCIIFQSTIAFHKNSNSKLIRKEEEIVIIEVIIRKLDYSCYWNNYSNSSSFKENPINELNRMANNKIVIKYQTSTNIRHFTLV